MTRRHFVRRAGLWVATAGALVLPRRAGATLPASDTFTGTDHTPLATYNAAWTVIVGAFETHLADDDPSLQVPAATNGWWRLARWTGETFADNQYAQALVGYRNYDGWIGVAVRIDTVGALSAYILYWNSVGFRFGKLETGTWTQWTTGPPPAVRSVMRLEANGTTIRALNDGAEIASQVDSLFTAGAAGVSGGGDSGNGSYLDNWEAGNISAGGARRKVVMVQ